MMPCETTTSGTEEGVSGISRVLAKLDRTIEAGNYYEAHQMYRTLYFRYTLQGKYDDCLELLYKGSFNLIAKQQETSAADLGLLILDTLEKRGKCKDSGLWIERIGDLIKRFSPATIERETIITRSIKWSSDVSGSFPGDPALYKTVAQVYWAEDNTELARRYYMLCRDGNLCGRILIKINEMKGIKSEADIFVVQAVLQQISMNDRKTAEDTFATYTSYHPQINRKQSPFKQPLLNFIYFLFRLIDTKNLEAFRNLCTLYKTELDRDEDFEKYLAKIGVQYFGANATTSPQSNRFGGMFGDVISRLLQGIEDDNAEQNEHPRDEAHSLD